MSERNVEGFRLSPQQRRVWTCLEQVEAGACQVEVEVRMDPAVDAAWVQRALEHLVQRYEILRTGYERVPGLALPIQVIGGAGVVDLEQSGQGLRLRAPALCADPASLGLLVRELGEACLALRAGVPVGAEDTLQYADIAEALNAHLESGEATAGRAHWRDRLERLAGAPRLPFATGQGLFSPRSMAVSLPAGLADDPALLLACWQVLLYRVTGQPEGVVGVCVPGRTFEGLDTAVGAFERTVPFVFRIEAGDRLAAVAERARREQEEALRWQDVFEWPSGSELATVGFRWDDFSGAVGPLEVTAVHGWGDRFTIQLAATRTRAGTALALRYDASAVAPAEALRWVERLETLLRSAALDRERPVAGLERVGPEEARLVLETFNRTARPWSTDACLHRLFEEAVDRHPDTLAVLSQGRSLSYRELDARANQVAHALRRRGVGPEVPVALCLERSCELIVGLLGILKAGGAYLPLDPLLPAGRREQLVAGAGAPVLLDRAAVDAALASGPTQRPELPCSPDNLCYVLYTSGSTGAPKGVMVTHRSVINLARALDARIYGGDAPTGMRVSLNGPLSFDTSVKQLTRLLHGCTLHLIPEESRFDASALLAELERQGTEVLDCTPTQLRLLLDSGLATRLPHALRRVLVGGEAVDPATWSALATLPGVASHNLYGPTECTVDATSCTLEPGTAPTLGQPLANVQVYVLDELLRPCPVGAAGELYIGGAGLARGYLGRPELTAERFVPDPFGARPGARLYRTGDRGRHLPDGRIAFQGRTDTQVKIRGARVELGEIEAVLSRHPAVREAVVDVRQDASRTETLVAWYVPRSHFARHRLPNGLEVAHLNRNETGWLYKRIFEDRAYLRHGLALREGDCILDVGANLGLFSLFAFQQRRDVRILAFEPNPEVCALLKANLDTYGVPARVFEHAVGEAESRASFVAYPRFSFFSGLHANPEEEKAVVRSLLRQQRQADGPSEALVDAMLEHRFERRELTVPVRPLSSVMDTEGVEQIGLLKINVEKSEEAVLAGIEPRHWPRIRQVVGEVHDTDGRLARIQALLLRQGFRVVVERDWSLEADSHIHYVYATREEAPPAAPEAGTPPWDVPATRHGGVTVSALREHLGARLPDYMVPSHYVPLDALPHNAHGKLDRARLPAPGTGRPLLSEELVPPQTRYERLVAEAWQEVLGLEGVGVRDNFFDLGGHSLLLLKAMERLQGRVQHPLTVVEMFEHPTVLSLARYLSGREGAEEEATAGVGEKRRQSVERMDAQRARRRSGAGEPR